jgi:soluble lytic murein transglycosylase-like protein
MEARGLIKYTLLLISIIIIYSIIRLPSNEVVVKSVKIESKNGEVNVPKSLALYEMIIKYSEIYQIPKYIAFNVAYRETRYKGPFHWDYKPEQGSYAGALGPMQIMPATGKSIYKLMGYTDTLTNDKLRNNIELNVMLSMKILRRSYDKYENWAIVCGKYNTGKPIINEYAIYCSSNMDYKSKWDFYIK